MRTFARVRRDLVEAEQLPPTSQNHLPSEHFNTIFECWQPEEMEHEEFNLLIKETDGRPFLVMSIDFEFLTEAETIEETRAKKWEVRS